MLQEVCFSPFCCLTKDLSLAWCLLNGALSNLSFLKQAAYKYSSIDKNIRKHCDYVIAIPVFFLAGELQ